MGKNSAVKTLGKRIGNVVVHMLVQKYTARPESRGHLQREEATYRDEAIKDSRSYNWNKKDRTELKREALKFVEKQANNKYPDLDLPLDEAAVLIEEEMVELGI